MLFRKMLRDMRKHKAQFISIFLMSFLGVYIYAGVNSEGYGVGASVDEYYEETNLADVWLYANDFDDEELDIIKKINGVEQVQRNLYIEAVGDFDNTPKIYTSFLE